MADKIEPSALPPGSAGPITFRQVTRDDADVIREIYNEIGAWLHEVKGITTQWERVPPEYLIQALANSTDTYLAEMAGHVVGTVRVTESPSVGLDNWGPDAAYIYSLSVRPRFRRQAVGRQILDWVEAQARERGKTYLRLDCMADNARLIQYYVDAGFEFLGRHPQQHDYALFEKKIV